jgi:dCMP deaminase
VFWDKYYLRMSQLVATAGTCSRRQVGCILVDKKNRILATGFNGVPSFFPHCRTRPGEHPSLAVKCPGALARSGTDLDKCLASHAERNALTQCRNSDDIHTVYCTASPCISCVKDLMNTGAKRIVFLEEYPHPESKTLWLQQCTKDFCAREWIHIPAETLYDFGDPA